MAGRCWREDLPCELEMKKKETITEKVFMMKNNKPLTLEDRIQFAHFS